MLLGSGNVATQLAHAFSKAGTPVVQVYNRSPHGRSLIEPSIRGGFTSEIDKIIKDADYYVLAISDDAIEKIASQVNIENKDAVICHTSGNVSINVFQNNFPNFGCLYPLQSFTKEYLLSFREIPIFISANSISTGNSLDQLAHQLSDRVVHIPDAERSKLHIPAVMVNNFVNHIYAQAFDYCTRESLDFQYLIPLIEETVSRVKRNEHPKLYQTGPAVRNDQKTLRNHRNNMFNYPQVRKLYNYITQHIIKYHRENH